MTYRENILFRRLCRWLLRWRHRCGYGIHSPFAFQFVTGVIYETTPYYAYSSLSSTLTAHTFYGAAYDRQSGMLEKDLCLLFRLANFCHPHRMVLWGNVGQAAQYLHAPGLRRDAAPSLVTLFYADSPFDLHLPSPDADDEALTDGSMVIVRNIHQDERTEKVWNQLKSRSDVTLTFDIGRLGMALRNDKLNKQDYIVAYF